MLRLFTMIFFLQDCHRRRRQRSEGDSFPDAEQFSRIFQAFDNSSVSTASIGSKSRKERFEIFGSSETTKSRGRFVYESDFVKGPADNDLGLEREQRSVGLKFFVTKEATFAGSDRR